jgi:hypothetical protein
MIVPAAHILVSGGLLRRVPRHLDRAPDQREHVPDGWECDPTGLESIPDRRECAPGELEASGDGARSPGAARQGEMAARWRPGHGALVPADQHAHGSGVRRGH